MHVLLGLGRGVVNLTGSSSSVVHDLSNSVEGMGEVERSEDWNGGKKKEVVDIGVGGGDRGVA